MPFSLPARHGRQACRLLSTAAVLLSVCPTFAAEPPTVDLALSFKPAQKGINIDVPSKDEIAQCKVEVERRNKLSGWMVLGPQGQVLRRYLDTNEDNVVDQWRYFRNGIEVYRDLDTNANSKIDQSRWVNEGGTRWGIDSNEDGKIDSWKILSAEEASQVAVEAILQGNADLLSTVLINAEDLKSLGVNEALSKQLLDSVAAPAETMAKVTEGSKVFTSGARWIKLDSSTPGLIPVDEGKAEQDVRVHENAVAIIDVAGQTHLAQIGEIIRVGEVWKLTQVPQPIEGENFQIASGGILMQPAMVTPNGVPGGISPKMREQLEALQKLDSEAPSPADGVEAFAKYNARRADILAGLVDASDTPEDKEMWTRQFADSVSAAVTTGVYPEGLQKLEAIEKQLASEKADDTLRSYVLYRKLFADYNQRLRKADAEGRVDVQKWWLTQLTSFVETYPDTPDAAEALISLALAEEITGNLDQAMAWYGKLAEDHPETAPGKQAAGALHRLGLKGKQFAITGAGLKGGKLSASDFRGKVLLVLFWSTTCKPCEDDLPALRALYQQHKSQGFEILGVNLDPTSDGVEAYLAKQQVSWPQIHEPGGQESKPARDFGIVSLPVMILVDKDGRVLSRSTSVESLKEQLPALLKSGT